MSRLPQFTQHLEIQASTSVQKFWFSWLQTRRTRARLPNRLHRCATKKSPKHGHVFATGIQALSANLLPPDGEGADIASLQRLLKDWAANNQAATDKVGWIIGFGYDDSQLKEQRHPTRDELDQEAVVQDFLREEQTDLPDDIRFLIDNSGNKEVIMEVVTSFQSDGVTITRDIVAAIMATLQVTEGVISMFHQKGVKSLAASPLLTAFVLVWR